MKLIFMSLLAVALGAVLSPAEDKGICAPAPAVKTNRTISSDRSGKIIVLAVVSDTGYVCDTRVIDGIDEKSDAGAENIVRQWRFAPLKKDSHRARFLVTVGVHYERDKDGNATLSAHQAPPAEKAPK